MIGIEREERYCEIAADQCDLVTDTHAIEIDFAKGGKAYEAVGQAMHYTKILNTTPGRSGTLSAGIVLLVRANADRRWAMVTVNAVAGWKDENGNGIRVWGFRTSELEN